MKPNNHKTLLLLFASLTVCLMIVPSGFAAPGSAPAISGISFDTNETSPDGFSWNATTFGGLFYPVNQNKNIIASENWTGERLQYVEKDEQDELGKEHPGNHVIGEDELVYSTRPLSFKYELVSDLELNPKTTPAKLGGMFYYKLG
jgi:hypothetical protein